MKMYISILVLSGWVGAALLPGARPYAGNSVRQEQKEIPASPATEADDLRLDTEHGPVHVWRPAGYDPRTAGIVVYVHGFFTSLDQAWAGDHLAEQFQASGRNAVFIAPEAPQSTHDAISWDSLEALLHAVEEAAPFPLPGGPLVVVGHSGAYRTILAWLHEPRLQCVILLDGMYGGQAEFHAWLRVPPRGPSHRMILVAIDTWRRSNRFARRTPGALRRRSIPEKSSSFTPRETRARLLFLRSQYGHMEIISSGKVIPPLLEITVLKPLKDNRESPPSRSLRPPKHISSRVASFSTGPPFSR
jgi:hypothetical protein